LQVNRRLGKLFNFLPQVVVMASKLLILEIQRVEQRFGSLQFG